MDRMPNQYMQTLWVLWNTRIISEQQVADGVKLYGYTLEVISEEGIIAINKDTRYEFNALKHVQ